MGCFDGMRGIWLGGNVSIWSDAGTRRAGKLFSFISRAGWEEMSPGMLVDEGILGAGWGS